MKATEVFSKTKWAIDHAHSEIGFKVRHLMIAHVKGTFKIFDSSDNYNQNNYEDLLKSNFELY